MARQRTSRSGKILKVSGLAVLSLVLLAACAQMGMHMLGGGHAERPADAEFGFGPRGSAGGLYTASLEPGAPIRVRRMQTMRLVVSDARGEAVEGAAIEVDGGMPEHGHGLPTRPRVTRSVGGGVYEVEGMKFNMRGWWEVKFAIATPAGPDTVTFNLDL